MIAALLLAVVTLVQSNKIDTGPTKTTPLAFTSANTEGNFILVAVRAGGLPQTFTVTDSRGNTYKKALQYALTADGSAVGLLYAENVVAGINTVTISDTTSGSLRVAIFEYSGIAPENSLDQMAITNGSSTSLVSPQVTTTADGDLIIGLFSTANGTTINAVAPAVIEARIPSSSAKLAVSDMTQETAGPINMRATASSIQIWAAGVAAFFVGEAPTSPGTYLGGVGNEPFHQWEWDKVIGTDTNSDGIPDQGVPTGYRIYYTQANCCSAGTCRWLIAQTIDIPADVNHCGTLHCNSVSTCCGDFSVEPPGNVVFFVVTAYNSVGESITQHGAVVPTPCP